MSNVYQPSYDAFVSEIDAVEPKTTGTSWQLLYAHDCGGEPTAGDLNLLIEAIRNGHRVRMLIEFKHKNQEYITEAENIWIKNNTVFAQNTSLVSVSFHRDKLSFHEDSYHCMMVVSTKGDLDTIRWSVGEHKKRGHTQDKVAVKWFVD